MNALLIESILDRYVAQAERREKNWQAKEVEALLLKLREEVLQCLKWSLFAPFNPDSAVERELMSKEQTFRSEDNALWDCKWQISNSKNMESAICDLKFRGLAKDSLLQARPLITFNCGIRVQGSSLKCARRALFSGQALNFLAADNE
jgi:hypothetical protein